MAIQTTHLAARHKGSNDSRAAIKALRETSPARLSRGGTMRQRGRDERPPGREGALHHPGPIRPPPRGFWEGRGRGRPMQASLPACSAARSCPCRRCRCRAEKMAEGGAADLETQRTDVAALLKTALRKGDTW